MNKPPPCDGGLELQCTGDANGYVEPDEHIFDLMHMHSKSPNATIANCVLLVGPEVADYCLTCSWDACLVQCQQQNVEEICLVRATF